MLMTSSNVETGRTAALPESNPFQRLAQLLNGKEPGDEPVIMTIGEPQHPVPAFTAQILADHLSDFRRYPPIQGTPDFREAVADWLDRRYGLEGSIDRACGVLPLNGSREGLSFGAISARDQLKKDVKRPAVLLPNPFYHTYAAAAHLADADAVFLHTGSNTGFLPDLDSVDPALLDRTVAFYIASPANPQGSVASLDYWQKLIGLARKHRFYVFADECYSEIYRTTPPVGVLEAAHKLGQGYEYVIAFNSLSKRSNLAGLRCGFAAGDPEFLAKWVKFRGLAAPTVPIPHQAVAARAYSEEEHVIQNRAFYNEKYALAEELLSPLMGPVTPEGGFYLWLNVAKWGGGVSVTERLWSDTGVKLLPGAYLSVDIDNVNPGADYVRVSLCPLADVTAKALRRIANWLGDSA